MITGKYLEGDGAGAATGAAAGGADAMCVAAGVAYAWREWSLCRGRDALYAWSDAAALELSTGSNGWFRFLLDGKLATMYSSGSPEHQTDNTGNVLPLMRRLSGRDKTASCYFLVMYFSVCHFLYVVSIINVLYCDAKVMELVLKVSGHLSLLLTSLLCDKETIEECFE